MFQSEYIVLESINYDMPLAEHSDYYYFKSNFIPKFSQNLAYDIDSFFWNEMDVSE